MSSENLHFNRILQGKVNYKERISKTCTEGIAQWQKMFVSHIRSWLLSDTSGEGHLHPFVFSKSSLWRAFRGPAPPEVTLIRNLVL